MYRLGLVNTLVTHAKMKGFGLTPLFGDRRGYMPLQLKTKINNLDNQKFAFRPSTQERVVKISEKVISSIMDDPPT